ncbi:HAF repeat-containing protein [Frankia sp. Cpl3]|uniref:HAF repeat-containing protein n=1 Tax=Parafrankia colletiae TaxID=573497 RepID=UPI001F51E63B|nr:HAF repeat-containing protein [Parafrankia colletiae]MCK9901938.1 HAF repeat-containing protein [Frankia sp. Cpl3]
MAGLAITLSLVGSVAAVGGAGVASAATAPAGGGAPRVTVTDLGAPDLLAASLFPEDLNNQGVVAGYGLLGGPQPFQAFTWSQGTRTPLPAPTADPGAFSFPVAINNQGQVAGFTTVGGTRHSLRWDAGTPTDISAPGGNSHPLAINDPGQVLLQEGGSPALWDNGTRTAVAPFPVTNAVGLNDAGQVFGTGRGTDGQDRAFVWTRTGTVDVGSFGLTTTAVDLNDGGQLVGNGALTRSPNYTHGFVWTPPRNGRAAALTDIGTLAGLETEVRDISDAGVVVGRSSTQTGWHAVRWTNGRLTDLGVLRGGSSSEAIAVNESGQAAGWASASDGRAHATLWKNGRLIDLGIPSGFTQSYAVDINDAGLVLGYAIQDLTGAVHSLVWTVTGG